MFQLPYFDPNEEINFDEFVELDVINLLHPSDPAYDIVENFTSPSGYLSVFIHGSSNGIIAAKIYDSKGYYIDREVYSIESVADAISDSGLWDCEPIMLMACHSGRYIIDCPGQELSDLTGVLVYAPKTKLFLNKQGKYFVFDGDPRTMTTYKLSDEYQKTMWQEFLPITY